MNRRPATTLATPSETEIVITRVIAAPRRLVFEAYTRPEHVRRWLLGPDGWSMPICEIDLRIGGAWRYVWRREDGDELEMRGVYREIVPPERIVATESVHALPDTINTLILTESGGMTTITQHVRYASRAARDAARATGMLEGMAMGFNRLEAYLAERG